MNKSLLGAVVPLFVLAACEADVALPSKDGGAVQMNADADGRVAFNLPFAKGEIKLPAAMMAEGKLNLDGVQLPEGAKMSGFNLDAKEGQPAKVNLSFTAPMAPEAVKTYFLQQFREQGVEARMVADAIQGTTKEGTEFALRFTPDGNGTRGNIVIDDAR